MIERPHCLQSIQTALQRSRIVALIGPRQVGKTTLARHFLEPDSLNYFDLEDPVSLARLVEPMTALKPLAGLVVIDEVQRAPDLFPVLRVLADRGGTPARFLLLGSASPALLRQASESLAGRVEVIEINGFDLVEVGAEGTETLWQRGGFPLSFLAANEEDSRVWRKQFIQTFVERDLPQLGFNIPAQAMWRFWAMLAHYHVQIWNAAEPARSLGLSEATVRRYLDLLTGAFLVRQLPPWHENIGKRQVKAPKVYVRDTGLLHQLLGLADAAALLSHPKCGASWEGFVLEEVLRKTRPDAAYFWATHGGAELDILLFKHGRRYGVEIKRADAPRLTPSMRHAMEDLRLDGLTVVYPGNKPYSLAELVRVIPLGMVTECMMDG
ncbi:MAG: ATP-binding protein [Proteobacteria bacterium]|nr:ATP-binding protein [Pseudomonadota bacterium]